MCCCGCGVAGCILVYFGDDDDCGDNTGDHDDEHLSENAGRCGGICFDDDIDGLLLRSSCVCVCVCVFANNLQFGVTYTLCCCAFPQCFKAIALFCVWCSCTMKNEAISFLACDVI